MTTFAQETKKCAICGKESTFPVLMSSSSFGPMDLDTRPAPLMRYTLNNQIEFCNHCHYAGVDISRAPSWLDKQWLNSDEYLTLASANIGETAKAFILAALLCEKGKQHEKAGFLYLKAAWAFDDEGLGRDIDPDLDNSHWARTQAVQNLMKTDLDNIDARTVAVDLYRRLGKFDSAQRVAEMLLKVGAEGFVADVLRFQLKLIEAKDSRLHNVGEV